MKISSSSKKKYGAKNLIDINDDSKDCTKNYTIYLEIV